MKENKIKEIILKNKIKILLSLVVIVFIFSIYVFFFSGKYAIKNIDILGQTNFTKDKVIKMSKINMKKNIYLMNLSTLEKNILKNTYVEKVKIKRKFPSTLTIFLNERVPACSLPLLNGYVIIDENMRALSIVRKEEDIVKPMIKGIKVTNVKLGEIIPSENEEKKEKMENILKLIKEVSMEDLLKNISYIDLKKLDDISMTTKSNILVKFGNLDNLEYKTKFLNEILIALYEKGKTKGVIDMRFNTDPFYYEQEAENG